MLLKRLKWIAILAPIGFVGLLEYARFALAPLLESWKGRLLMDAVVLMGALFFYGAVFTVFSDVLESLERKNRGLMALRSAGLDIISDLSLDNLLQKVVDQARNLIGARYGALSLIDKTGRIEVFVTSGISREQRDKIGDPPQGKGLLGVVLREGQHLRLADVRRDARFSGLPSHHPEMRSLLAVPIVCVSSHRGNLYLSEKLDGSEFTGDEEGALTRFASQAAIAIDNAHLHDQVKSLAVAEERLRIAHEMHDGQAQVLAYVNTKAQAVREMLRGGRTKEAGEQLEQLAAAAREVYADVREGILGLRSAAGSTHGFTDAIRSHIEQWQDQCGIQTELVVDAEPTLRPEVELQLVRIVQEALANVRKHSKAERVRVQVRAIGGGVEITVEDFGVGFELEALGRSERPRFGLATMRERAEAIGATLEVRSRLEIGTRIELRYREPDRMPSQVLPKEPAGERAHQPRA